MPLFDPSKRPTEEVWDKLTPYLAETVWGSALEEMASLDALYLGTNEIWASWERLNPRRKGARPNLHQGRARAMVDQAVSSNFPLVPTWHRLPVGEGKDHKDRADALERGATVAFNHAIANSAMIPTALNATQLILHNHTIVGTLLDEEALTKPVQKEGETKEDFQKREWGWWARNHTWNPLRLEVPQPGEVLMSPLEKHSPVAIRRRKLKAYDLAAHTVAREGRKRTDKVGRFREAFVELFHLEKDAYEDIDIEEWWSADWYALRRKGGEILVSEPCVLGIQPFVQTWGKAGVIPAREEFDLKYLVQQSFLHQEKEALEMYDQTTAGHHNIIMRKAFARYVTSGNTSVVAEALEEGIIPLNPQDFGIEETPELAAQSFQHRQSLQEELERNTYSPMNVGFKTPGVDTATGMLLQSEAGHRTFASYLIQMGGLWSMVGSNALMLEYRLSDTYGEDWATISLEGHSLRKRDMEDRFHIEAKFEQVDAAVQMQLRADARIDLQQGNIGREQYWRIAGYEDVGGIQKSLIEDMVERDPEVVEQYLINAFRRKGEAAIADKRQAELDLQVAQRLMAASGQGGAPGMPPGMPQGMAPPPGMGQPSNGMGGPPQ